MQVPKQKFRQPRVKSWTTFDQHILNQSEKHNLDFDDLKNAAYCIESKYKGLVQKEQHYARLVQNSTEKLWHEAYFCALFLKSLKWEKWSLHTPNLNDIYAVNQDIKNIVLNGE